MTTDTRTHPLPQALASGRSLPTPPEKESIRTRSFEPAEVEAGWGNYWEHSGLCAPVGSGEPFSLMIPPPNVTGTLHVGHALGHTLMDVITRTKRMQGFDALWLPGVDHAGIATQMVVERHLKEQGQSRLDLGREAFEAKVWEWKETYHGRIGAQMRRLGSSVDWSRERFTLDDGFKAAVLEAFVKLYHDGLIYRGAYLVNWDVQLGTAVSDLEVDHKNQTGKLWHIAYPLADGSGEIVVATTRPETIIADVAIAVNPADDRWKHLIGKTALIPVLNIPIPIIADDYVKIDFGAGALKVTPGHDINDYAIGQRHGLEALSAINKDGTMADLRNSPIAGMERFKAKKEFIRLIEEAGLLRDITEHEQVLGYSQRSGALIEPLLSTEWFVKTGELAPKALAILDSGELQFFHARWGAEYRRWLEDIRDWCISRALWWGHRIPAWHCQRCNAITVAATNPVACGECASHDLIQDESVLDTWFSSAMWPFGTLGWPEQTNDLARFYPNSLMITGYDIIFFWVVRMALMGTHFMEATPFRHCFIHGLVRDEKGQKMSKTKGNVVDPFDLFAQYGVDATRWSLASSVFQGKQDVNLAGDKLTGAKYFMNKIWNASKFMLSNITEPFAREELGTIETWLRGEAKGKNCTLADRWILARLRHCQSEMDRQMAAYGYGEACQALYDFFWKELCDWYLEAAKGQLAGEPLVRQRTQRMLQYLLMQTLALLHPVVPFITEEINKELPGDYIPLIVTPWPDIPRAFRSESAEQEFALMQDLLGAIRNLRKEIGLADSVKSRVQLQATDEDLRMLLVDQAPLLLQLANLSSVDLLGTESTAPERSLMNAVGELKAYLLVDDASGLAGEIVRLQKEAAKARDYATKQAAKLTNESFVSRAPASVIEAERAKLAATEEEASSLESRAERLAGLV
ncbi:MAG: valine--tRNA ligase [bacterium]